MCFFSYGWIKAIKFFLVLSTWVSGFTSGILFGKIAKLFQSNCLLYANVTFSLRTKASDVDNKTHTDVHVETATWGDTETCNLVTFEGVVVSITSFIWIWFFLNMDIGSVSPSDLDIALPLKRHQHWRDYFGRFHSIFYRRENEMRESRNSLFILPPIVVNSILCSISLFRVAYASDGYQQFCFSLCTATKNITCEHPNDGCRKLQYHRWVILSSKNAKPQAFPFHNAMKAALVMSWIEPLLLATHVLVIMAQVYLEANPIDTASMENSPEYSDSSRRISDWTTKSRASELGDLNNPARYDLPTALPEQLQLPQTKTTLSFQAPAESNQRQIKPRPSISLPPFNMFEVSARNAAASEMKPTRVNIAPIPSASVPEESPPMDSSPDQATAVVPKMSDVMKSEAAVFKRPKRSSMKPKETTKD